MASVSEVKSFLVETTVPQGIIDESLAQASALWLMSAPAELLAADVVLCHPPIGPHEVRAAAYPMDDGGTRLTVVAHDRPGLLADSAAALAAEGLSISAASAMTWSRSGVALHALTISPPGLTHDRWTQLAGRLRAIDGAAPGARPSGSTQPGARPGASPSTGSTGPGSGPGERLSGSIEIGRGPAPVEFVPVGRAEVTTSPSAMGRCVVTVVAPDQVGLLWAICRWFADQGVSIEAAHVGVESGRVRDHFIVVGRPDGGDLARRLTATRSAPSLPGVAREVAGALIDLGAGSARRLVRTLRGRS